MTATRDAWTRPGCFEVAPGVRRIVCPLPQDGLRAVNVYAIDDGDGVALIDTGWNHPDIVTALTAALGSFERITAIICTHSHYDHYGLAGKLREWSGAPVLLGSDGAAEPQRRPRRRGLCAIERTGARTDDPARRRLAAGGQ